MRHTEAQVMQVDARRAGDATKTITRISINGEPFRIETFTFASDCSAYLYRGESDTPIDDTWSLLEQTK